MRALQDMPISFPGLFGDWSFNPDPIAVHIGHGIYWYGIILAIGLLAGLVLCMKQAKRYGLTEDNVLDMVLWAVPSCIIGARLYYVIFYLDLYRNADGSLNWGEMVAVWDGGLAIYGAVIAGAIVAFFYTRHKKIKMGAMTDLAVMGLLLGQCIGRRPIRHHQLQLHQLIHIVPQRQRHSIRSVGPLRHMALYLGAPQCRLVIGSDVSVRPLPHGQRQAGLADLAVLHALVGDGVPSLLCQAKVLRLHQIIETLGIVEIVDTIIAHGQILHILRCQRLRHTGGDI